MAKKLHYLSRIVLAKKRQPDFFKAGYYDVCIQHDDGCPILSDSGDCECFPDITITAESGKFSVSGNGRLRKCGPEAEAIPVMHDPRQFKGN